MKVVKLKIKNFLDIKNLENLEKEINGNNIILLGENGVGKSSIMQFIQIALGSKKELPENASGEGTIITDDNGRQWTFNLEFKKGKPVISVISPDGIKNDRKSVLAQIVGAIDFDIDEFVALSETTAGRKKQVEIYKSFLDEETKKLITSEENRVAKFYDERTEKNKEIKIYEGALSEHPFRQIYDFIPDSPIDIESIKNQINDGLEKNKIIDDVELRMSQRVNEISEIDAEIQRLNEKKAELEKKNIQAKEYLSANRKVDLQGLMAQKDDADTLNSRLSQKADYNQRLNHLNKLKDEAGDLTVLIDTSRQAISDAIKDCSLPVDGLAFDSENLLYNGVPVTNNNLSTSEIMELGIRMKIAENPTLGLLFIERGESLGIKRLNTIREIAKKYNMQMFMEQVDRGNEKLTIEIMEKVLGETSN